MANFEETIEKELDKELVASEFEEGSFQEIDSPSEEIEDDNAYWSRLNTVLLQSEHGVIGVHW